MKSRRGQLPCVLSGAAFERRPVSADCVVIPNGLWTLLRRKNTSRCSSHDTSSTLVRSVASRCMTAAGRSGYWETIGSSFTCTRWRFFAAT